MDMNLIMIPITLFLVAIVILIVLRIRCRMPVEDVKGIVREYVIEEIPNMRNKVFDVVNLADENTRIPHIWIIAYNNEGMYLLPTVINIFTHSLKKYEDETPEMNIKKQLAKRITSAKGIEEIDYLPVSAIRNVLIIQDKKTIVIEIGTVRKSFKYYEYDCFGAEDGSEVSRFLNYLKSSINNCSIYEHS